MRIVAILLLPLLLVGAAAAANDEDKANHQEANDERNVILQQPPTIRINKIRKLQQISTQQQQIEDGNTSLTSFLSSWFNTLTSVFQSDCPVGGTWILESTVTFGLNSGSVAATDVSDTTAAVAIALIEVYLQDEATEIGICEFETNAFSYKGISNVDSSANTVAIDIDWSLDQQLCGTEKAVHTAAKELDWSTIVSLWSQYGVQQGNQFVGAITSLNYACTRDQQC